MKRNKSLQKPTNGVQNSECVEYNLLYPKESQNSGHVYNNICRVCLDIGNIPIFGNDGSPDIFDDIEKFGDILIRSDDNFPKHICECCEKLLQAAVLFRKTAKQTDKYLQNQQDNVDVKYTVDFVKSELETSVKDSNVEIETDSPINIKEEIIIEPTGFLNLDTKDTFNAEENNANKKLQTVANSTVSSSVSCIINFRTADKYSQHKKSVKHKNARHSNKIECGVCLKKISKPYYDRHIGTHSNDKDEKLQCPICNKSYSKTYFNYHITHTHNKGSKKSKMERILCNICNKSYEKQYYKFHLAIHSNDSSSSRYVCDTCGKSFIQQSTFKRHRLIHGNELAFKCPHCPYRGRHPGLVKTHMQTHTRDYQHRCMECPARFLTKSNLNKHLKRHKGPVDFKCDTCKRGFYSKLELDRHFEADHLGVKNHICNICGKAFGYRNAMMSHQLKVHKREKLTNGKGRMPLYLEANMKED